MEEGHGTHTAGSAAGATLNDPAETAVCSSTDELGCIGECFNSSELESFIEDISYPLNFDTWCPQHECDGYGEDYVPCMDEGNIPCALPRTVPCILYAATSLNCAVSRSCALSLQT